MPSPVGQALRTMDLPEALRAVLMGQKITKLEWQDERFYVFFRNDRLTLAKPGNTFHDWIISSADFEGDDWVIIHNN